MTLASSSRRLALLAALASSALLAACGGGGGDGAGTTNLRAINLTTDLPSVDLFTSDTRRFSALATDTVATSISLEANTYTLNVKKANDGASLLTGSYTLGKDQNYTAVIWGRETALRVSTLPEDENVDSILDANNTKIRFFNATTDTGALDIFITPANTDLGAALPLQSSLSSGSLSGFRDTTSGSFRLRVTGAGDPNDVRLDIASIALPAKKYATLVLTAGAGGVLVNGTLIEQRGAVATLKNTSSRVRMVASVANAGNISASLGSSTLVGALRSPGVGPYTLVPAGNQALTVRVNGATISSATRETFDAELARVIDGFAPDLLLLAGFMRILTDGFVERYAGRLLNIHPSLLPAFAGLHTHRRAIEAGCKLAGATVHFVTPTLDHGPIVAQAAVPVLAHDTPMLLSARVLVAEHQLYPLAVRWFVRGELLLDGGLVRHRNGASQLLLSAG